jgi:5'-methylthioadenosine phosphorylase
MSSDAEASSPPSGTPAATQPVGATLAVLGGSGFYELPGLTDVIDKVVETPFGAPSGPVREGRLGDTRVLFLARHGAGHRLLPSEVNYRANVHALKQLGARRLLSVSAVGSLRAGIAPGDLVLPDQFIDKTHRRETTFFGGGVAAHVAFNEPVCPALSAEAAAAIAEVGAVTIAPAARDVVPVPGRAPGFHRGGTYVCMEGPQFSSRAESLLHRSWGADVIGMTAATEAKLAREAGLCFALLALSTDYDAWNPAEEAVHTQAVIDVLHANIARARAVVAALARAQARPHAAAPPCSCAHALEHAVLTNPDSITPEARERLSVLFGSLWRSP